DLPRRLRVGYHRRSAAEQSRLSVSAQLVLHHPARDGNHSILLYHLSRFEFQVWDDTGTEYFVCSTPSRPVVRDRLARVQHDSDFHRLRNWNYGDRVASREWNLAVHGRLGNYDWRTRAASDGLCVHRVRFGVAHRWHQRGGCFYSAGRIDTGN